MDCRDYGLVTRSTVYRTLVRNGLIAPESQRRSRRDRRWERVVPMQLWQLDVTGSVFLADDTECKLIIPQRILQFKKLMTGPRFIASERLLRYKVPA
jgi:hypothetical protein